MLGHDRLCAAGRPDALGGPVGGDDRAGPAWPGWRDRCVGPANLLSGAALVTLLLNPADLFDVGCQLSFLAVAAIVWGVPRGPRRGTRRCSTPLDVLERRLEPWWRTSAGWG